MFNYHIIIEGIVNIVICIVSFAWIPIVFLSCGFCTFDCSYIVTKLVTNQSVKISIILD